MVRPVLATAVLLLATICVADETIVVDSVISGSPAAAAGLLDGDRIIGLAGQKIATQDDLQKIMEAHQPGDTVVLTVQREGETVDLSLTFGERPGGGVSIGVRLAIGRSPGGAPGERSEGTVECLAWIDKTYRIDAMIEDLGLELSDDYKTILSCVEGDTQRMPSDAAVKYCDNVFKVHCSALDLLTEIGEAQTRQCEELLEASLGLRLGQYEGWKTCAEQKVFDRYSMDGESSDEAACRAAFLDECGTNIDATSGISSEQQAFVECCSADTFESEGRGDSGQCRMIDDGFSRGPCRDRSICVNRLTSEWIQCSALE